MEENLRFLSPPSPYLNCIGSNEAISMYFTVYKSSDYKGMQQRQEILSRVNHD